MLDQSHDNNTMNYIVLYLNNVSHVSDQLTEAKCFLPSFIKQCLRWQIYCLEKFYLYDALAECHTVSHSVN